MRVLIIEDETGLADVIRAEFEDENYETDICEDGQDGYFQGLSDIYDIIILDGMLPRMDGYDILRKWRAEGIETPVLMLTARSELADKLKGLDIGADDYLTKPFEMEELLARARVITRRQGKVETERMGFGDISLDLRTCILHKQDSNAEVQLGKKEFQIMEYLIRNSRQIVTREQIAQKLWGYDCDAEYNNVEVYISFTRRKMKFIECQTRIKAVRGIGYRLEMDDG
ncbi:MAG: response regulator transcription factor [Clostridium sp.]|nr:response regulator transcription factor [Clostridium sp.]